MIPVHLHPLYPNPVQYLDGTPVAIFRDHRLTLPVMFIAAVKGYIPLPARIVTFDRHKDALVPHNGIEPLTRFRLSERRFDDLIELVVNHLSPRNDDWIVGGMELGLISDVVQFRTEDEREETMDTVTVHSDGSGVTHRIFHLGRPHRELCYKGALADPEHEASLKGLWSVLGWDPELPGLLSHYDPFVLDIDLDYFTCAWDKYVIPFNDEMYDDEFGGSCQAEYYEEYDTIRFLRELRDTAVLIAIATEPEFCGKRGKAARILEDVNKRLFENRLAVDAISTGDEEDN